MFDEIKKVHYRGVLCSKCHEPIPVFSRASALRDELQSGAADPLRDAKPFSFALRCNVCHEESVYAAGEIQDFEGEPRRQSRSTPSRFLRFRAAHG
jgi:hypothetical protein